MLKNSQSRPTGTKKQTNKELKRSSDNPGFCQCAISSFLFRRAHIPIHFHFSCLLLAYIHTLNVSSSPIHVRTPPHPITLSLLFRWRFNTHTPYSYFVPPSHPFSHCNSHCNICILSSVLASLCRLTRPLLLVTSVPFPSPTPPHPSSVPIPSLNPPSPYANTTFPFPPRLTAQRATA